MIRRPPGSTPKPSSAASDVYKRQVIGFAAETNDLLANAQTKLTKKKADMIVANPVDATHGFNADTDTAVSYTHLRAHETVLDLVCRLLLEKKKTKNNNTHGIKTLCIKYRKLRRF
ncbi:phosphopantothenoylcysteine synthetase/decarboxylase [Lactobacillus rhamnosus GG] [Lacticaseibacillus rhamnosus]|nr:phosphopantothenoylcysteine synthetase/decarboxylase [Lactobacillus rhamnosus GG] [Lacticaseibacillus rhamnosus]